jgi:hypothetical protein
MAKKDAALVSNFNLQALNTKQLSEHIGNSIAIGTNLAVFGRRGSGKTEIAKTQIALSGCKEIYLNLSVLERPDLGGYPNIMSADVSREFVKFLLPHFYEAMIYGDQDVVALLDEVDKADASLWAPLLEFTQFRSINGRKLPRLRCALMTGNLISEGGARPSLPLLDRTEKYIVEADAQKWLEWAGHHNIHPAVTAFIHDNNNELLGNADPADRYADPSPRSWTQSSRIVQAGEKFKWSADMINEKVAGCVGNEAAMKYKMYYTYYQDVLPLVDLVYKGESVQQKYHTLKKSQQIVLAMIACSRFSNLVDNTNRDAKTETEYQNGLVHLPKFFNYIDKEVALIGVRSQITPGRLSKHNILAHKEWKDALREVRKATNGE